MRIDLCLERPQLRLARQHLISQRGLLRFPRRLLLQNQVVAHHREEVERHADLEEQRGVRRNCLRICIPGQGPHSRRSRSGDHMRGDDLRDAAASERQGPARITSRKGEEA